MSEPGVSNELLVAQTIQSITRSLAVREIHHRIGNMLTILVASLRIGLTPASGSELQRALLRHERQIIAIAQLHQFFAAEIEEGALSASEYFERLCDLLTRAILEPVGVRCEALICDSVLPAARCQQLGLIVTEFVTNAAKHAFRETAGGYVRIDISSCGTIWSCIVSDNGTGMRHRSRGTGSQIVDGLIEGLGGKLHLKTGPEGTAVSVLFDAWPAC
ncbi:MAG TPA: sensor histidine kinase [Rhizomicrobium sp.]|nr:sensor histidine kinase [Rhizomicrobium sp.]